MSAHTPGPWRYGDMGWLTAMRIADGSRNIAQVACPSQHPAVEAESAANRALLAAAPDLLAALQVAARLLGVPDRPLTPIKGHPEPDWSIAIRAALAKAKGEA